MDPVHPQEDMIEQGAAMLRRGGVVAFPTETVYGLGADALNPAAVNRIFAAKRRPPDNPLIVHLADPAGMAPLVSAVPEAAWRLADRFWPGPLTLVMPCSRAVPQAVTAGLPTVALRIPAHPVALALIRSARVPVAAPSANLSGRPSPTAGNHVLKDLDGRIDGVLDGGPCSIGVESTVLDLTAAVPIILRPGGVTLEDLREELGDVVIDPGVQAGGTELPVSPRSPGMKYTHYAPLAEVYLVEGELARVTAEILRRVRVGQQAGRRVGVLATEETAARYGEAACQPNFLAVLGSRSELAVVAANLYSALRECDRQGMDLVLAETFGQAGLGLAIMNRLHKAAGGRVIKA